MSTPSASSPSLPAIPPGVTIGNTLGAVFLGTVVAAMLFGVTCSQLFTYFTQGKRNDHPLFKSVVLFLFSLDIMEMVAVIYMSYFYAVSNYGNVVALFNPTWGTPIAQFAICTSDAVIRSIFTYRIWKLSRSWWVTGPNAIGIIVVLAFGWKNMASELRLKSFLEFGEISTDIYIGFGGSALIDTMIAFTLCVLLFRRRTGFQSTDSQIQLLMIYVVNTGAFASVVVIICLILYAVKPNTEIFIAPYAAGSKLYFNALLASLNSRDSIRTKKDNSIVLSSINIPQGSGGHITSVNSPTVVGDGDLEGRGGMGWKVGKGGKASKGGKGQIEIKVDTMKHTSSPDSFVDMDRSLSMVDVKVYPQSPSLDP
ncbi:hypothetical protein C8Q75DRAFT_497135 [Abortiporus biennis]|nr:hypothetical protein C8Q75DRAFT_497135 [Abortiporus biennis]